MFRVRSWWGRGRSDRAIPAGLPALFLLALTVACLPTPGAAQQPLIGVATDRETSAPLPGVYVALDARAEGQRVAATLTDESGRFVLSAEVGGIYRLRAERVGLATEVTEWFTFEEGAAPQRISLVERAVELDGLSVSAPVRTCRLEPEEATVVQRWWDEVRKALKVTAFLEESEAEGLRFERFEREWTSNLRTLRSERYLPVDSVPSWPFLSQDAETPYLSANIVPARLFLSQDAETLSERGFVQGEEGERWFLAPDAAVLFSETFLADHCLGIAEAGDDEGDGVGGQAGELRLAVEPTRRRPPDIRGVLTVDTLSGELRSFDFEYVNLPRDTPRNSKGGGHLTFEYLASGEWIVSDWWIRMPQTWRPHLTIQTDSPGGSTVFLAGYFDRGGRVVEVGGRAAELGARLGKGTLHGTVYDSLTGGPLAGARVSVVGSRLSTRTESDGRFTLPDVPAGRHGLTFHHAELTLMGLPSPVVPVNVAKGSSDSVALATPGFASVAAWFCENRTGRPAAILAGRVLGAVGAEPASSALIRASWLAGPGGASGAGRSMRAEGRAGSDGRYFFCYLPSDVPITLAVQTDSATWREAGTVELPGSRIVTRELRPGAKARAVVRGTVRTAEGGEPLVGTDVWLLAVSGDTVASARADEAGVFRMIVPAGVGYRVVAVADGHAREASAAFTVASAESLDVDFESVASVTDLALQIEGLVVEVEARSRAVAKRLLRQYGQSPENLGRRWLDRATLSSMPISGGDAGIAIQSQGIPGVWVKEGLKFGRNPILCVTHLNARASACAIIVLDGVKIDLGIALSIDFHDLEAIAVLSPEDATTFYGTEAFGGAVLLWTRSDGR